MSKRSLLALLGVACVASFVTWSFSGGQVVVRDGTVSRYQMSVIGEPGKSNAWVFDSTSGHAWMVDLDGTWHDFKTPEAGLAAQKSS
jgi:hypothetical protein